MRTSRIVSVLGVCALMAAPAYAQGKNSGAPAEPGFQFGVFGGLNSTNLAGNDATGMSSHTGFSVGARLQRNNGNMFFRVGANYSARGAEESGVTFGINYIEIPALVGYNIPMSGSLHPYVMGGAQLGIIASCKLSGGGSSMSCKDAGADMQSTDYGLVGGLGVGLPIGRATFTVDARYVFGMQNVEKTSDAKNRGFTVGVGYMFPLHK